MTVLELPAAKVDRSLSGLRRRDAAPFEALVREHQDRIYAFCTRMLGEPEEAFDVTQEIFLAVHRHLDGFRADASLTTWLYRIARNHCLNRLQYLERRGRGRKDEYGEGNEQAITESQGGAPRPDEVLASRQEQARVQRAVGRLDHDQRALVVLRDLEGLSYEAIAEVAELPLGTVKSRLHRARERLAALLGELDGEVDHAR
jgi:RNA polymerase sigma-70 factor (ECF subfamily)